VSHALPWDLVFLSSCLGGFQCCHVSYGFKFYLPTQEGSSVTTCHMTSDPASMLRRTLTLSRVPQHWTLPPCSGRLRRCHMSHDSGSYLSAQKSFGATTCPTALNPTSLLGRAPVLPCVPQHRTLPPYSGGLRCCHVSRGSLWAADLKNKEMFNWPTYVTRLTCF
jgi:hypothetical protein